MSYFGCVLRPGEARHEKIKRTMKILKRRRAHFDAIAARGMSGMAVAPILAYRFDVPLFVVRKPGDNSHATCAVSHGIQGADYSDCFGGRYVIVDDFVCSGSTVRAIVREMKKQQPRARCVGAVLYDDHGCGDITHYDDDGDDGEGIGSAIPRWTLRTRKK